MGETAKRKKREERKIKYPEDNTGQLNPSPFTDNLMLFIEKLILRNKFWTNILMKDRSLSQLQFLSVVECKS